MKLRIILNLAALSFACSSNLSANAELESVKLQLKWTHQFQFAGYYAAQEQGYYADVGLDVQFIERTASITPVGQVTSGNAEYGVGDSGLILNRAKGAPIKALAAIFQHSPMVLISKKSSGIISPYELHGKRLMMNTNTEEHAPLRALLANTKLSHDNFNSIAHTHNYDAFINNKVDIISAYLTDAPFYFQEQGIEVNIINPQNYGINFYGDILFTSDQELKSHPGRADRFLEASLKGWRYALTHKAELVQLIHSKYKSTLSLNALLNEAKATEKLILVDIIPLGELKTSRLQRITEVYAQFDLAKKLSTKELEEFIYNKSAPSNLSTQEQAWLDQHPILSFTGDPNWLPYEAFDADNQYIGIVAEHLKLVEQQLGINFNIVPSKSWQESVVKVRNGEVDIISETIDSELRKEMDFTKAYLSSPIVIVMAEHQPYVDNIQQIADKKIALIKDYGYVQQITTKYPELDYYWVNNIEEGLEAVSSGKVDALFSTLTHTAYQISKAAISNTRIVGKTEFTNDLALGVKKEYAPLIPILNRAFAAITEQEKKQIFDKWGDTQFAPETDYILIAKIAGVFLLLIAISLYWIRKLHYQIMARERAEKALLISEQSFRSLLDGVPDIAVQGFNAQREIFFWNKASEILYGFSAKEAIGQKIEDLIFPEHLKDNYIATVTEHLEYGLPIEAAEIEIKNKAGDPVNVFSSHVMQINAHGVKEMFCIDIDLTKQKQAQEQLKILSLAVQYSPSAVMITDVNSIIEYINPKFTEITGYSIDNVVGKKTSLLASGKTRPEVYTDLWNTILSGNVWRGKLQNRKKNSDLYWSREFIAPIINDAGDITHFVSMQEDITESKRINDEVHHRANHDMLTGLVNRSEFERRLKNIVKRKDCTHALCFLDLDQFKIVNDTSGHVAGDELLRQLGLLLDANVRQRDTLARLGGDEFAILMEHCDSENALITAEKIRQIIEDFQFNWDARSFRIGVSIGLTIINESNKSPSEILKQADLACYAAKDGGRNRIHIYQADDEQLVQTEGDIHWASRISEALENDYFRLFVQQIAPISNSNLDTSYEILLRLVEPNGDIIPPGAFLPAVERYNLAYKVDRWVINKTFQWIAENKNQLDHIHHFAINLSGQSLGNEALLAHIIKLFSEHGIPSNKITFEITETAAISNLRDASNFIKTLKQHGCSFALDDFGSGLSSFAYLKNLPVDYLKIDGMFVKDILNDPIDAAMVRSINEIGHVMNIKTIAEFVESKEILQQLEIIGVDFAQGYGIGKPFPLNNLLLIV